MTMPPAFAIALYKTVDGTVCEQLTRQIIGLCRGHTHADVLLALAYVTAIEIRQSDESFDAVVEGFPELLRLCATVVPEP